MHRYFRFAFAAALVSRYAMTVQRLFGCPPGCQGERTYDQAVVAGHDWDPDLVGCRDINPDFELALYAVVPPHNRGH
jgi:hypothetical protein